MDLFVDVIAEGLRQGHILILLRKAKETTARLAAVGAEEVNYFTHYKDEYEKAEP